MPIPEKESCYLGRRLHNQILNTIDLLRLSAWMRRRRGWNGLHLQISVYIVQGFVAQVPPRGFYIPGHAAVVRHAVHYDRPVWPSAAVYFNRSLKELTKVAVRQPHALIPAIGRTFLVFALCLGRRACRRKRVGSVFTGLTPADANTGKGRRSVCSLA